MSRRISDEQFRAGKALLNKAFADLRKQGIMAKQKYLCCMGCASSSLGEEIKKSPTKYIGGVYYHSQDAEDLRERGTCYIGFGALNGSCGLDEETASLMVGHALKLTMERYGFGVKWAGTTDQRICITFPKAA